MDTALIAMARKAKTSEQFSIVVFQLDKAVSDAGNRRAAIGDEIENAFFGKGDVAKLREEFASLGADIDTMNAALNGARKRHAEALLVEQKKAEDEHVVERDEQAKVLVEKMRKFHEAIAAARGALAEMDPEKRKLDGLNDTLPEYRRINVKGLQMKLREADIKVNTGLSRNGMALDKMLIELGTPLQKITLLRRPTMFNKPSGSLEGIPPAGTIAG